MLTIKHKEIKQMIYLISVYEKKDSVVKMTYDIYSNKEKMLVALDRWRNKGYTLLPCSEPTKPHMTKWCEWDKYTDNIIIKM